MDEQANEPVATSLLESYGRTKCGFCGTWTRTSGRKTHWQSKTCRVAQARLEAPDWPILDWQIRGLIMGLAMTWQEGEQLFKSPLIRKVPWNYRRPGWGRRGRTDDRTFIHPMLETIIRAKALTNADKIAAFHLDADSPQFQAFYTTAALGG